MPLGSRKARRQEDKKGGKLVGDGGGVGLLGEKARGMGGTVEDGEVNEGNLGTSWIAENFVSWGAIKKADRERRNIVM